MLPPPLTSQGESTPAAGVEEEEANEQELAMEPPPTCDGSSCIRLALPKKSFSIEPSL